MLIFIFRLKHYNLETESFAPDAKHGPAITPFLPEIRDFAHHTYHYIVRRILGLISLVLGLEEDALWKLHDHDEPIGAACQRFMAYYPRTDAEEKSTTGIWTKGHTDCEWISHLVYILSFPAHPACLCQPDNTISLLFSQPITALQILTPENDWKWVKHVEGAAVVNVADALDCKFSLNLSTWRILLIVLPTP